MSPGARIEDRNSWGISQFVIAALIAAGVLWVWRSLPLRVEQPLSDRVFILFGVVAALLAGWFGHSSYPRVHNFKVYAMSLGVATVSVAALILLVLVPRFFSVQGALFSSATILISYGSLLFIFLVTVIVPEYLGFQLTRTATLLLIGLVILGYLLGLSIGPVRLLLGIALRELQDLQSSAFWTLSSVAAAVLFLSLFSEAHSMGIGGIHAGGVMILSVGWLAPGADIFLHTLVITALPVMVALGTLIHWFQRLENRASYDPLTRIYNRGWCDRLITEQSKVDTRPPCAVALIDLDHFKAVNDTHGHDAGDAVLREAAQRIRSTVLPRGVVGRYGGEELLVFLPQYDANAAQELLEQVRTVLESQPVTYKNEQIPITGSIGFCLRTEREQPLATVLTAADRALYAAKDGGRNQVRSGRLRRRSE